MISLLGPLRIGLLVIAALVTLLSAIDWLLFRPPGSGIGNGLWDLASGVIAPTLAPMVLVLLLFDWIMSRFRASDDEDPDAPRFRRLQRIAGIALLLSLGYWVPYFAVMTS
jgi:hypothetical protein